jgi:hypothetical protein
MASVGPDLDLFDDPENTILFATATHLRRDSFMPNSSVSIMMSPES